MHAHVLQKIETAVLDYVSLDVQLLAILCIRFSWPKVGHYAVETSLLSRFAFQF